MYISLPSILTLVTSASSQEAVCKKTYTKPNIIYLMFDDLGYGDLGCYGQTQIETPNIDALAANGLRFTDMYTACPLSAPSRGAILTGMHMGHAQIRNNVNPYFDDIPDSLVSKYGDNSMFLNTDYEGQAPLQANTYTLGHMMKDNGYRTAMIGKWGLGGPRSEAIPNKMGFDYFYGFLCQQVAHVYYPHVMWENNQLVKTGNRLIIPGEEFPSSLDSLDARNYDCYSDKYYSPDLMFDKIQQFVAQNAQHPFFLMWTTTVPHSAVQAPKDEVQYYVDKLGDEAPITRPGMYYPCRYPHASYAAMITHIDRQVGQLVEQLKQMGIYDNTIIIVTSDNGPACNPNSPMEYFNSGGLFRCRKGWGKSSLHEGGIRMPFIVSWNNHIPAGTTDIVTSFTDLMPTFAELTGTKAPKGDGISFAPTLKGKKKQKKHPHLYWEFPGGKGWIAVRMGLWKGICKKVHEGNSRMELFHLGTDPQELHDISTRHPDIVKKMWTIVKKEHLDSQAPWPKFNTKPHYPNEK